MRYLYNILIGNYNLFNLAEGTVIIIPKQQDRKNLRLLIAKLYAKVYSLKF